MRDTDLTESFPYLPELVGQKPETLHDLGIRFDDRRVELAPAVRERHERLRGRELQLGLHLRRGAGVARFRCAPL